MLGRVGSVALLLLSVSALLVQALSPLSIYLAYLFVVFAASTGVPYLVIALAWRVDIGRTARDDRLEDNGVNGLDGLSLAVESLCQYGPQTDGWSM